MAVRRILLIGALAGAALVSTPTTAAADPTHLRFWSTPAGTYEDTAFHDGELFATYGGAQDGVAVFDEDGGLLRTFGHGAGDGSDLDEPRGIDVAADGTVWVVDAGHDRVLAYDEDGTRLDREITDLDDPTGIAIGPTGQLFVADTGANVLRRYTATGSQDGASRGIAGPVASRPTGIDVLTDGTLLVADDGNDRILHLDYAAEVDQNLATWPSVGDAPWGVAAADDGSFWVADGAGPVQHHEADGDPVSTVPGVDWVTTVGTDVYVTAATTVDRFGPPTSHLRAQAVAPGEVVEGDTYDVDVVLTNAGNQPLSGVTLTSTDAPDCAATVGDLPAGDPRGTGTTTVECTVTVERGTLTFVDGWAQPELVVTADSDQTDAEELVIAPLVAEERFALVPGYSGPATVVAGQTITFTASAQNTGNRPLTGLTASDPSAACGGFSPTPLPVGATATATCTRATTDAGTVSNTVTVESDQTAPASPAAVQVTVTEAPAPAMEVEVEAGQAAVRIGRRYSYDVRVRNTGNVPLTHVVVGRLPCASLVDQTIAVGATIATGCEATATRTDFPEIHIATGATSDQTGFVAGNVETIRVNRLRTDAMVRFGSRPFVGNDRYSADPTRQRVAPTMRHNQVIDFRVRIQNDGSTRDHLEVRLREFTFFGWQNRYLLNGRDVTRTLRQGVLVLRNVPAGGHRDLIVRVWAANRFMSAGDRQWIDLSTRSGIALPGEVNRTRDSVEIVTVRR